MDIQNISLDMVVELASTHRIFVSAHPVIVGTDLKYHYRIVEPKYDYDGWSWPFDAESDSIYDSYTEALRAGVGYVLHAAYKTQSGLLSLIKG